MNLDNITEGSWLAGVAKSQMRGTVIIYDKGHENEAVNEYL